MSTEASISKTLICTKAYIQDRLEWALQLKNASYSGTSNEIRLEKKYQPSLTNA